MKTLHAITLRKRSTWVTVVSCFMLVALIASFVAWPSPEAVNESGLNRAFLATIAERWASLALWSGLALVAFGPQLLRAGGVIGALGGEASEGRVVFWWPAIPWRSERRTFVADGSAPLKISVVERSDMFPTARFPHLLLEQGDKAYAAKLDGKLHTFTASGVVELAKHAGITVKVDATAKDVVAATSPA